MTDSKKPYMPVVGRLLEARRAKSILDAPSGNGWLRDVVDSECSLTGVDLYDDPPAAYHAFHQYDLDDGLPDGLGDFDAVVSCEGIEHLTNPGAFLRAVRRHLRPEGVTILTTPNVWYSESRLKYLVRGFFPSFPCLVGHIVPGNHMHVMPWSYPHLFLHLKLQGFQSIRLHDVAEQKPKRFGEGLLGYPLKRYCSKKFEAARSDEERQFWTDAGSDQSIHGRRLVVSAEPAPLPEE